MDDLIDPQVDLFNLPRSQVTVETEITFRFLLFDVRAERPTAIEHPDHRPDEDVFGGMHTWVVALRIPVVLIHASLFDLRTIFHNLRIIH